MWERIITWSLFHSFFGGFTPISNRYAIEKALQGESFILKLADPEAFMGEFARRTGWLREAKKLGLLYAIRKIISGPRNRFGEEYNISSPDGFWTLALSMSPGKFGRLLYAVRRRADKILSSFKEEYHPSWEDIARSIIKTRRVGKAAVIAVAMTLYPRGSEEEDNEQSLWEEKIGLNYKRARDFLSDPTHPRYTYTPPKRMTGEEWMEETDTTKEVVYYIVWSGEGARSSFSPYTQKEFGELSQDDLYWVDRSYRNPRAVSCQVKEVRLRITDGNPEIMNGIFSGRGVYGEDPKKKYIGVSYYSREMGYADNGVIPAGPWTKRDNLRAFLLSMYRKCLEDGSVAIG